MRRGIGCRSDVRGNGVDRPKRRAVYTSENNGIWDHAHVLIVVVIVKMHVMDMKMYMMVKISYVYGIA